MDVAGDIDGVPYAMGTTSQLEHTATCCREAGVTASVHQTDIRDLDGLGAVVDATVDRFGQLDVLVNSAGIVGPAGKRADEMSEDEWSLMIDVDLSGTWRAIRAVGGHMVSRRAGSIVNIASTAGVVGYRHFAGYVAAKHGVVGLTKAAALDLAPHRVRVNALCPGSVRDDMRMEGRMLREIARCLEVPLETHEQTFLSDQPMHRLIEPDDVAHAAVWLASDEARHVSGSVVMVDAAFTTR